MTYVWSGLTVLVVYIVVYWLVDKRYRDFKENMSSMLNDTLRQVMILNVLLLRKKIITEKQLIDLRIDDRAARILSTKLCLAALHKRESAEGGDADAIA